MATSTIAVEFKVSNKKAATRLSNALDNNAKTDPSNCKRVSDKNELSRMLKKY